MDYTELPDNIWAVACGTRSIIREATIQIRSTEVSGGFRQPKLLIYVLSQRPAEPNKELIADNGPMIYIANAMTPFSPKDVTIYSNCDEVRLTYCKGGKEYTYHKAGK